ncbi:MAG: hypothetical protein QG591_1867 [Planctomycetota bacterium]|nr:hypothetical protein [Planctomycetota bacterium]
MNDNERRNALISAISYGESRLTALDKERHKILAELKSLRAELLKLTNHSPDITSNATNSPHENISNISSPEEKCSKCSRRSFAPATDNVIRGHLEGKHTIGVYPLLTDETCWFLAIDFDMESWANDVNAFMETCRSLKIPAVLERSRMDSYDRLFPNQDTMPKGVFGNLIALPLQKEACKKGNTLFLNQHFQPYEDQWTFLSSITRMKLAEVDANVNAAERNGQIIGVGISSTDEDDEPWTKTLPQKQPEKTINFPLPGRIKVVISNLIYVEKDGLSLFTSYHIYKPSIIACVSSFEDYCILLIIGLL